MTFLEAIRVERIKAEPRTEPSVSRTYYTLDESGELWWCNSHERKATHIQHRQDGHSSHHCDPKLGGILLPCFPVNLTGKCEIVYE